MDASTRCGSPSFQGSSPSQSFPLGAGGSARFGVKFVGASFGHQGVGPEE